MQTISFEGMNPNISERSTKDGIVRRVSFEVDQDTYDAVKAFNLKGMIVSGSLGVTDGEMFGEEKKPLKNSNKAALMCKNEMFQKYTAIETGLPATEKTATDYLKQYCGIDSRSEFDTDVDAWGSYLSVVNDFNKWINHG